MNKQKAYEIIERYFKGDNGTFRVDKLLFTDLIDAICDDPSQEKPIASYCEVSKTPYIGKQCPYCHFSSDEPKPEGKLADKFEDYEVLVHTKSGLKSGRLDEQSCRNLAEAAQAHYLSVLPQQSQIIPRPDWLREDFLKYQGFKDCLEAVKKAIGEA